MFVGDDASPLKPYLLKPFPFRNQTNEQRIFSYRLSRARGVIENSFGIMAKRFRILQTPILLSPEKAVKIVVTCVVLHNYLRRENCADYMDHSDLDREQEERGTVVTGSWHNENTMAPLERNKERNQSQSSKEIRDDFTRFFNNEGQIKIVRYFLANNITYCLSS